MHGINPVDHGRTIDWGKTSEDYSTYRSGPPASFYERLKVLGVGLKDQTILDLGTGTGLLAREFAKNQALVTGTDISEGQIEAAKKQAEQQNLKINFQVAAAESQPFPDHSFDVITANQCWLYFDKAKVIPEVKRLLKKDGMLVTSHFSWLVREDKVAQQSEALILKHNPQWTASDWPGIIPVSPKWAEGHFKIKAMFYYDELIPYTREAWRGRMRACRGVGASMSEKEVFAFDQEHEELLKKIAPENFSVLHRLDAHFFVV